MTQEDYKLRRRIKTLDTASTLLDDLQFIRTTVVNDKPTNGEVRRLSSLLRRILIDEDLLKVASPRTGHPQLIAPVSSHFEELSKSYPYLFFSLAGTKILGIYFYANCVQSSDATYPKDVNPDERVELSLDAFMKQNVMAVDGKWVNRNQILKYIANKAGGIHIDDKIKDIDILIRKARHQSMIRLNSNGLMMGFNFNADENASRALSPDEIDCVLIEIWAMASFLIESPDILSLENYIKNELGS